MTIAEDIRNNSIILVIMPKEKYHKDVMEIVRATEKNSRKVCYVCFNEPANFIARNILSNKIPLEKFFFIDTLTKNVQEVNDVDACTFVSAPNALTEISLAFSNALNEKHCDATIFDTLSALLIYENANSIIQFMHGILTKLRISGGRAVFIALKEDVNSEMVKDLYMFVDKVIELS